MAGKLVGNSRKNIACLEWAHARRWLAGVGGLLEGVGEPQELALAPGPAGEGEAERIVGRLLAVEARDEARRHLHAGIARLGGDRGAGGAGEDHRVELVLAH